ncbi:hypothetical protein MKX03_018359 [Papaver bracteatum]|nr:hypothetical protein MKX03_018359 [Papaver bracteatum]
MFEPIASLQHLRKGRFLRTFLESPPLRRFGILKATADADVPTVVAAATRNMGIGKDGKLPWRLPSDLKFFKEVTMGSSDPSKRNAVVMAVGEELLWFISGSTNAKVLKEKGIHIWDDREEGDLGPVYGFQWRQFDTDYSGQGFDQLLDVIEKIKNKPDERRIILSSWNPLDLGLISFLVILSMLFGDAHVYKTHVRPLQKQLQKLPRPFPTLKISSEKKDIDSFVATDFKLMDYDPRRKIEMKMAV